MMGNELKYGKLNIIICKNIESNPHCPHGPALLFERIQANGIAHKFYACSAYKSRKECPFFVPYDSVVTCHKSLLKRSGKKFKRSSYLRFLKCKELQQKDRIYCRTCSNLLLPDEFDSHKIHDVLKNVSDYQLSHPSQLLHLQTNSKGESQFIFTDKSVDVIINGLKALEISKVLCLGTPSIHERITECESGIVSLFLDIDHRYKQFYDETKFCWFNMMNFYFFENPKALERVKHFLSAPDVVLVMDPPFSAREEPLAYTLTKFNSLFQYSNKDRVLPVIWIFPYFKEKEVLDSWPGMVMLDYDVTYTNQKQFKGKSKTSVVRVFTNLDASKFTLPVEDGYHFCSDCNRWISKFNNHCLKCDTCPSKNGHPYKHCDICMRCVKEYWNHCNICGRCALKQHPCDLWKESNRKCTKKRKMKLEKLENSASKKSKKEVINEQKSCRVKKKKKNKVFPV